VRLVCFDIDGTLIWTDGAGRRAIHRAVGEVLAIEPVANFRFDGRTDGEIVLRFAAGAGLAPDAELMDRVLARYVENLGDELGKPGHATKVYPGVRELLDLLEPRADCVLGLLTGNVIAGARLKLRSAGIEPGRFRVGAFGSDSHVRDELPAVAQARAGALTGRAIAGPDVVIIGDTPADVRCGRGIGARAIGVATASYSVEQLVEAGAHVAFADLSDVEAVVEAIFG